MSRVPPMRSPVRMMVRIKHDCVLLVFICLCFDIGRTFALGNKYVTISPSLFSFVWPFLAPVCLHLHSRTPFRHSPPLCCFSLSSLSSTEDKQDNMHQGFHLGDQQAPKTFATPSSTKCNPVELCLTLKIRNPFLDPSRLHKIPQLESLTMCLTHRIAR